MATAARRPEQEEAGGAGSQAVAATVQERPPPGAGRGPFAVAPWVVLLLGGGLVLFALLRLGLGLLERGRS